VIVIGAVGLAIGVFPGERNLLLTLLPAVMAAAGLAAVRLVSRGAASYRKRVEAEHPKVATSINSVASAVAATEEIVVHRSRRRSLLGALAYLGFDLLVLRMAFFAIHVHAVPGFAIVGMAYIIGGPANRSHCRPGSERWEGSPGC
jgi:hypothetical protein